MPLDRDRRNRTTTLFKKSTDLHKNFKSRCLVVVMDDVGDVRVFSSWKEHHLPDVNKLVRAS